jgi:hypothetical protein
MLYKKDINGPPPPIPLPQRGRARGDLTMGDPIMKIKASSNKMGSF